MVEDRLIVVFARDDGELVPAPGMVDPVVGRSGFETARNRAPSRMYAGHAQSLGGVSHGVVVRRGWEVFRSGRVADAVRRRERMEPNRQLGLGHAGRE